MYSYSKIVFGLKHQQDLYDCLTFIEVVKSAQLIIFEHNAFNDYCERPGLHYHGIIEHANDVNVENIYAVVRLREFCSYFYFDECHKPEEFVVELAQPPKKIMFIEIAKSFNLKTYYSKIAIAGIRLERSDYEKKDIEIENVKFIIDNILALRKINYETVWNEVKKSCCCTPDQLKTLVEHSIELVHQKILDQSILSLCDNFVQASENYYTILESVYLVLEWCNYQSVDVKEFTMNWINCMDRRIPSKNSLYFHGPFESGIWHIISSVAEVCPFIGRVEYETTGYTYVWEDCLEKRFIIMRDTIFDERMSAELNNILRGIGTFVPHRQTIMKYLRPTPVVIYNTDNKENISMQCLESSFLGSYVNLKPFQKLVNDPRLLHPDWLSVISTFLSNSEMNFTGIRSEDNMENLIDAKSTCQSIEKFEFDTSVKSGSIETSCLHP